MDSTFSSKDGDVKQEPSLDIENIIGHFASLEHIDDDACTKTLQYLKLLMATFHRQQKQQQLSEESSAVKSTVLRELKVLRNVICERMKNTFWFTVAHDAMFRHQHALHWIMARWFCSVQDQNSLPAWYQACLKIANAWNEKDTLCISVVEKLIVEIVCFEDA